MIEEVKGPGARRASAVCDECGKDEAYACAYIKRKDGPAVPNEKQVLAKAQKHGWTLISSVLRCPACEAKRKVVPITKPTPAEEAPREPTRAQKRAIIDMLEEVYDTEAERYTGGDTDASVAETLSVMPGWVTQIREDLFGPDGANDDMNRLDARIAQAQKSMLQVEAEATELRGRADDIEKRAKGMADALKDMRRDLHAIKQAVGPAARARAGVRA